RAAGMEAQIVAMYLLTSPHANMLGLYYCPTMFIAHETGLGLEGASKGLQRAIEAGFCEYDEASEVVWVIEMASYQIGEALKPNDLRVKGV
ncbi:replication protein, partial [Salmonella enterica]|nr:replication protein [Salmonella enterica]